MDPIDYASSLLVDVARLDQLGHLARYQWKCSDELEGPSELE